MLVGLRRRGRGGGGGEKRVVADCHWIVGGSGRVRRALRD